MDHPIDEWYSVDVEPKLNEKIDQLQKSLAEQSVMIQSLSDGLKSLQAEMKIRQERSTVQKDRMNELLEELRVLKQRELNMLIREKIPCPFFPIPSTIFPRRTPDL
jgi:chromosome segregation ATPase